MTQFKDKANLIWEAADLLRGDPPTTVLRRLDCVLAPNKQKVLDYLPEVEKLSDSAKDLTLNKIAKANFHNRSSFDFAKLVGDPNHIAVNLRKQISENGESKDIGYSTRLYSDFEENEFVKILPNEFFGYWRVTVEQPQKDKNGELVPQATREYFDREVNPHLPDAWIEEKKAKSGYEINFTKYFYEFTPLRSLAEIKADILALEESGLELEKTVPED